MNYLPINGRPSGASGNPTTTSHIPSISGVEQWLSTLSSDQLLVVQCWLEKNSANYNTGQDRKPYDSPCQGVEKLTARERDVLTLIARGYTRPEMAESLSISRHTAASHIASIYRKLDVGTIAEATVVAIRCGLVG